MSQALYRKLRPQSWNEIIGQDHVVSTLQNALTAGRIGHAYLFAGPRGTGKTTTARLLAKTVNCLEEKIEGRPCGKCKHCEAVSQGRFLDLIEIDAASNTSVDDVRDLRDKINFSPNQGRYKVYIIDEVHMLSTAAFNALLKTLEEPPPHAIFVLATTEVHKIPATVMSRCQRHEFRRLPLVEITNQLANIVTGENMKAEERALELIARQATGSMRDAISLLDQLASSGNEITLEFAQEVLGTATSQAVIELIEAVIQREAHRGLTQIHAALDAGSDPRQYARQVVDYLRGLLLFHTNNFNQVEADDRTREKMQDYAALFTTDQLLKIIKNFNYAAYEARNSWLPSLPLEIAFIESLDTNPPHTQEDRQEESNRGGATPTARKLAPDASQPAVELSPGDQEELRTLNAAWPQFLNMVRRVKPNASGLLNSTRSRYIKDSELVLCFSSPVVKKLMEKEGNLEAIQQILKQLFQKEISVRCELDTSIQNSIPPEVDESGMVAAVVRDLGGKIIDIQ